MKKKNYVLFYFIHFLNSKSLILSKEKILFKFVILELSHIIKYLRCIYFQLNSTVVKIKLKTILYLGFSFQILMYSICLFIKGEIVLSKDYVPVYCDQWGNVQEKLYLQKLLLEVHMSLTEVSRVSLMKEKLP